MEILPGVHTWRSLFISGGKVIDDLFPGAHPLATLMLPPSCHMEQSWKDAWSAAKEVTQCAAAQLQDISLSDACWQALRSVGLCSARCLADTTAWCHALCAALAMDGWVMKPLTAHASQRGQNVELDDHSWLHHVQLACRTKAAPSSLLSSCLKLLRRPEPHPPPLMMNESKELLKAPETHQGWCSYLQEQTVWPNPYDTAYHQHVSSKAVSALRRAWANRGCGPWDADIAEGEYKLVICDLKTSRATTPDLIPRAAYKVGDSGWDTFTWLCIRLMGPAALALRPHLWRETSLAHRHKKGPLYLYESWRLLEI